MMLMVLEVKVIMMKSKKKVKPLKKLFKSIYKLIDKLIVTPISTIVYKIQKKLGKESKLEKILNLKSYFFKYLIQIIKITKK